MQKVLRMVVLLVCFVFTVSCCFTKVPPINHADNAMVANNKVPIDPGAVVFILGKDMEMEGDMSGSAIIIESSLEESWGITAAHVCYPEVMDPWVLRLDAWLMIAIDINGDIRPIEVLALDTESDVCIFKMPYESVGVVPLADKMPLIGERVYLGAFPLGVYEPGHVPFFEGFYAGKLGGKDSFTIPVAPGSSGGGIVNQRGELIGIVSMAIQGFENITLTANIENIQTLLDVAKKNPDRLTIIR